MQQLVLGALMAQTESKHTWATFWSKVFHPKWVFLAIVGLVTWQFAVHGTASDGWAQLLIFSVASLAITFVLFKRRVNAGRTDDDLRDSCERLRVYQNGLIAMSLAAMPSWIFSTPQFVRAVELTLFVFIGGLYLITVIPKWLGGCCWHVSMHTGVLGFIVGLMVAFELPSPLIVAMAVITIAVAWARCYLDCHNRYQVTVGSIFGLIAPLLAF